MKVKKEEAKSIPAATAVTRYRKGHLPTFINQDENIEKVKNLVLEHKDVSRKPEKERYKSRETPFVAEVLAENVPEEEEFEEEEEFSENEEIKQEIPKSKKEHLEIARQKARQKISVPVMVSKVEDEEGSEDEEEIERRRARAKARSQQEEELLPMEEEKEEKIKEESEDESEYESEESEAELITRPHFAPVFKRKSERETLEEQKKIEEQYEALERERLKRLEEKKKETKEILQEELVKNELEKNQPEQVQENEEDLLVEDDVENNEDEAEEYEKWKLRELARIKREREEKEKARLEREEIERRRNLSDMEIQRIDADLLKPKQKKKWKFLQKYYHKGAFFRTFDDNDAIANEKKWDFGQATLEDKHDKTALPSVLQVKNFGKASRTKYTHLVDQDTTKWDSAWFQKDYLRSKYNNKMGGMGTVYPASKKRKV